jgi:hypothetical protein
MDCTAGKRGLEDSLELWHLIGTNDKNKPLRSSTRGSSSVQRAEAEQLAQNNGTHEQHSASASHL